MREVLFFTNGDANNANVWSNVPYCFSHALENKDITVHRIDYSMNPTFVKFYDLVLRRVLDAFSFRKLRFPYLRTTRLFKFFAERKIKKAIQQNPSTDLCLFMGYGFYNKWNKIPSLLFSDWTTEKDIQKRRKPNFLEKRIIRQEGEAINNAEYVVSLFPVCCEEMKKKYPKANIHFLGGNVINDLGPMRLSPTLPSREGASPSESPLKGDISLSPTLPSREEASPTSILPSREEVVYHTADPSLYGQLKELAKENRKHPTEEESVMWEILKGHFDGYKFRRQHIIGDYIVDFVCLSKQLIIEIDGGYHLEEEQQKLDEQRTEFLNNQGFHVIRFANEEVIGNTPSVIKSIKASLNPHSRGISASPQPSPQERELKSPLSGDLGGLLEKKSKSKKLLFIGRKTTYLGAAKKLIEAFKLLKQEEAYKDYVLDIVGCAASDFDSMPEGVTCYGFLNKSEEKDRKTYYDLLLGAKVLVNANPKWGAFSSTVEAMYYYTPVIVSPYQDFVKNFGEKIDFGVYNQDFTAESLANDIISVINSDNYIEMCTFAHEKVKTYTWENYVKRVLELASPFPPLKGG